MERSAKKTRFHIIDVLFIFVVLAVILGAVYFFKSRSADGVPDSKQIPITYTVQFKEVDSDVQPNISVGDAVVDSFSLKNVGTVASVDYAPGEHSVIDPKTGAMVSVTYPSEQTVIITVSANAQKNGSQYEIGGYRISIGTLVSLRLSGFTSGGYCTDISEGEVQ